MAETTEFDRIIPTGWLTAYGRTFTDIPYAGVFFEEIDKLRSSDGDASNMALMKDTALAPQFEARHKLLNKLIVETGIQQIIEVGAGLSTRGLEISKDTDVTYVELDLPKMMADKRKVMANLELDWKIPKHYNLHLVDGSATEPAGFQAATKLLNPDKQVIVVNEGLMVYLTFEEKAKFALNVAEVLKKFDGYWITSDASPKKIVGSRVDKMKIRQQQISTMVGREISRNSFFNYKHAEGFFQRLGFDVETRSFTEIEGQLTSLARLGMEGQYYNETSDTDNFFVMKLAKEKSI